MSIRTEETFSDDEGSAYLWLFAAGHLLLLWSSVIHHRHRVTLESVIRPGRSGHMVRPHLGSNQCANVNGKFQCQTGDCASGQIPCNGAGGIPPVTLAEFTLAANNGQDFFDISLVDGFNLPLSIAPQLGSGGCTPVSCSANMNAVCPPELQVKGSDGGVVACNSACLAFNQPQYCCTESYGTPQTCPPTNYSNIFKSQCPQAYSYAYDDTTALASCTADPTADSSASQLRELVISAGPVYTAKGKATGSFGAGSSKGNVSEHDRGLEEVFDSLETLKKLPHEAPSLAPKLAGKGNKENTDVNLQERDNSVAAKGSIVQMDSSLNSRAVPGPGQRNHMAVRIVEEGQRGVLWEVGDCSMSGPIRSSGARSAQRLAASAKADWISLPLSNVTSKPSLANTGIDGNVRTLSGDRPTDISTANIVQEVLDGVSKQV
ncbi:hypothetical protein V6N12_035664 [Hibiscus sabdariffa]|uniref:Uncharacterized protein n=1 Tax=Hibiscus sabdariffa TaxID=183260 RepID=A0ABR2ENE5_9ROSI